MKSINLIAVVMAVCVASGCSQNRWQVRDTSPTDGYQPPASLANSTSTQSDIQPDTGFEQASAPAVDDQTPYISLVSATNEQTVGPRTLPMRPHPR